MAQSITSHKSGPVRGQTIVPGDKSISHRSLIFSALATGHSEIVGLLESEDVLATAEALKNLGADIYREGECWHVTGCGLGGFQQPSAPLDLGNSGTGVRLLMGAVSGSGIRPGFIGDESLSRRPMARVLDPLRMMGVQPETDENDTLPLTLNCPDRLLPIEYTLKVASAQVKSAILLAGLQAPGVTTIVEPVLTRDHTERLLDYFGADLTLEPTDTGRTIAIRGETDLTGRSVTVAGDPSSTAFLAAAALICPGSELKIQNILVNETRTGFFKTIEEMGAPIKLENQRLQCGEPVADLHIKHGNLSGVEVPEDRAPSMIDEYPILAVLSAFANGTTCMKGLKELRVKESDRLSGTADGLIKCGIPAEIDGDDLIVSGGPVRGGALIDANLDHRMAMSFLTLGLGSQEPIEVDHTETIGSSFPNYYQLMRDLGADLRIS
ncbi:MAG: 3-phosphoshikimate 1-carboxyvinyltransferase [Methyloligellaceae bacterium]